MALRQVCSARACYPLSDGVYRKIQQVTDATSTSGIEHGLAFCKGDDQTLIQEDECTGTNCSVRTAYCHYKHPKVANFHTHPYKEAERMMGILPTDTWETRERKSRAAIGFKATTPSFGDLINQAQQYHYAQSEGVQCITSPYTRNMSCYALRKVPNGGDMRALLAQYEKSNKGRQMGRKAWDAALGEGSYDEFWGDVPLSEVDIRDKLADDDGGGQPPPPGPTPPRQKPRMDARRYRKLLSQHKSQASTIAIKLAEIRKLEKPYRDEAKKASSALRAERRRITYDIRNVEKPVLAQMRVIPQGKYRSVWDDVFQLKEDATTLRKGNKAIIRDLYSSVNGSSELRRGGGGRWRARELHSRCARPQRHSCPIVRR